MSVTTDHGRSVEFLQKFHPGGMWVLTAIHPDQKRIETDTFGESGAAMAWLGKLGVDHNIYFEVNPPVRSLQKKAERSDIKELAWLHVDVDPKPGEPIAAEQTRILSSFEEKLPKAVPQPNCIVFSGGGYQAFWRLGEPIPIDGNLVAAEEAKLYNLQLEIIFGADPCHNVDRIMRLPGTVNWPNARKREKGRVPTLARLHRWEGTSYPLSAFTKAPAPADESKPRRGRHKIEVNDNVKRVTSVEDLPKQASELCKVVVVQGFDPDDPGRWPSRSEALFWAVCELVRAGCDDDLIYSVITDPDFGISTSVLDKGSKTKGYALHQIERARDQAIDPNLRELNDRHAVIKSIGGKCRILCEGRDPVLSRRTISFQSFQDFLNAYSNRQVSWLEGGKPQSCRLGQWWTNSMHRRQYDTVVFAPGMDVNGAYNLWSGFSVDPKPGDCTLFLDHILKNLCKSDKKNYDYLLRWMALAVQRPAKQGHVAVVLRGNRGTGKSIFANIFGYLFGNHYLRVSNAKHVTGSFNAHLQDCVVLFADEAFAASDKRAEAVLKTLVTEEMLTVEPKGVDAHMAPNFLHMIMASNEEWVIPAGLDERRFFVLDVGESRKQDTNYFRAMKKQMDGGGYSALLHMLLSLDLDKFEVRQVPETVALEQQKALSLGQKEEWWLGKLMSGHLIEGKGWPPYAFVSELVHDFAGHLKLFTRRVDETSNATSLGMFLTSMHPDFRRKVVSGRHNVVLQDGLTRQVERPSAYVVPSLAECRKAWETTVGKTVGWPEEIEAAAEKPEVF
jgi:hypothetical protein